jgi:hypothetical protein
VTRDDLFILHTQLCREAKKLMVAKNHDYSSKTDPFRSFRMFGGKGILVRMGDKLTRLESFMDKGELKVKDENVRDTVLDLINYSVLLYGYLQDGGKQ